MTLVVLAQFLGCGNTPPPTDGSNLPDEVRQYEERKKAERDAKAGAPK
jgi:hypothetical protein